MVFCFNMSNNEKGGLAAVLRIASIIISIFAALGGSIEAADLASPAAASGNVTYTLNKVSSPTVDESDAYAKIKIAMDSAVSYYNTYTSISKKLTISYVPSVATADGNINGSIRFGSNRSYMVCGTAMHEIAHTVGVGTCGAWAGLIVNGRYTGTNGNTAFRTIIGKSDTVLHGDSQHFWPYGINYASEVKSENDLINHCKIVNAMQKDFYPAAAFSKPSGKTKIAFLRASNSGSAIIYTVPKDGFVKLTMVAVSGRAATVLCEGRRAAGTYSMRFDRFQKSRGYYIGILDLGEYREYRKIIVLP